MSEMFDAVDALVASASALPPPAERERLRKAHGLTLDQVARALSVRRATAGAWESGKTEPRPPQREAYARLLHKLAELYPAAATTPTETADPTTAPTAPDTTPDTTGPSAPSVAPASKTAATQAGPARTSRPSSTSRRPPAKQAPAKPARTPAPAAVDERYRNGPLAVLDGAGSAYGTGGLVLDCPATALPALVDWALNDAALGAARLHRWGQNADPLLVLTTAATDAFGLPGRLTDRRRLRLAEDHPTVNQLATAGWQLTRRGFGPWPRIYRPAEKGRRQCVQLAILPWDALDERTWGAAATLPPTELARVLGTYATRVLTPRGSAAVCGLELMTALRPPTRPVRDTGSGTWTPEPVPGSLTEPVDPAPPEAPDEHPLLDGAFPRGHHRAPDQALDEEAYEWIRDPQLLTDTECAQPHVVGLDVNAAFLAAANRLTVGLSAPEHHTRPAFDKKTPGTWLADLSHTPLDPRLPSPFTPTGQTPTGPAWYTTPTLAYAAELGYDITPLEAWLRRESGPYLDPWYTRLRDAYLTTMADLGVTNNLDDEAFLAAMADHKTADPGQAAVLSAIKATVKGGIGKLRERPQGADYRPGRPWPALTRPTWRPDIRAAVIAQARTNMHRKMLRMADTAGLYPLAVLSDCVVYPAPGPSPLDVLPRTQEGKPAPGCFRLGVSPGMVKLEGTRPLLWAAELLDAGHNPARHIKDTSTAADQGE